MQRTASVRRITAKQRIAELEAQVTQLRWAEQLRRIERDVARSLSESSDLATGLQHMLSEVLQVEGVDGGAVYLVDPNTGALQLVAHEALPQSLVDAAQTCAPERYQARLVHAGKPVFAASTSSQLKQARRMSWAAEIRAAAVIPICHEGKAIASLNLASRTYDVFPDTIQEALKAISIHIGSAVSRLRAEAAWHQSEKNLQTLFDSVNDMVSVIDQGGAIRRVNRIMQDQLGYDAGELIGMDIMDLHPAELRESAEASFGAIMAGEKDTCSVPTITKDGSLIYTETKVVPGIWDGKPAFFGVSRDIGPHLAQETSLRKRQQFLNGLNEITRAALRASDSQTMLTSLTDQLHDLFEADNCYLTLWDEEHHYTIPVAATGPLRQDYPGMTVEPGERTVTEAVLNLGQPLVIEDPNNSPYLDPRAAQLFPQQRLMIALPLIADGHKLGAMLITFRRPHAVTPEEVTNGEQVAAQVSLALDKIRLLEEVQQRWEEAETLREAALTVTKSLDRDDVVARILEQLRLAVPYDAASVQLLVDDGLQIVGSYGYANPPHMLNQTYSLNTDSLHLEIVRTKEPFIVSDRPAVDRRSHPGTLPESHIRGLLGVPMLVGERLIGMITLGKVEPNFYTQTHVRLAEAFAAQAAVAIENSLLFEQAQQEIAERRRAETALRASEGMYRALIEQSEEGIILARVKELPLINPRAEEMLGMSLTEIQASGSTFMDFVVPADRERVLQTLRGLSQIETPAKRIEYSLLSRAGLEVEVEAVFSKVSFQGRHAIQGLLRDVTERKQIEERLRRQEQLAALGQLSGGIAHELRTMLATIMLNAEMDLMRGDLQPRVARHLKTIVGVSREAADLTQQVLDFSGNAVLELQRLDLSTCVGQVLNRLRKTLPEGIKLDFDDPDGICRIRADVGRVEQAIGNLISNSVDAMPHGGTIHCTVNRLTLEASDTPPVSEITAGEWVCLAIADTGMGMSEAVQAHIFEPFFTTKGVGEGRGLGMPQVYGIMHQHDGAIDVETTQGIGTTVRLYFPACPVPAD